MRYLVEGDGLIATACSAQSKIVIDIKAFCYGERVWKIWSGYCCDKFSP